MRISSIYKNDLTKVVKLILQDFILLQKLENFLCKTSPDTWYPPLPVIPPPLPSPLPPPKKEKKISIFVKPGLNINDNGKVDNNESIISNVLGSAVRGGYGNILCTPRR